MNIGSEHIDALHRSIRWFQENRPIYSEMLTFFGGLFEAQFRACDTVSIERLAVSDDVVQARKETKFPLIGISEFSVDVENARTLTAAIIDLARHSTDRLQEGAAFIEEGLRAGRLTHEMLFDMALQRLDEDHMPEGDPGLFLFFGYHSILPSILACRKIAMNHLADDEPWRTGYCPVCGGMPALSILDTNGERSYSCSFCRNRWVVPRLFCAYCSNTSGEELEYFESEEEPEYRIDSCLKCRRYVKTVDTRKTDRWVYPDIEMLATIHLDMKSMGDGLQPVVNNPYF